MNLNPRESEKLIESAGGSTAFARLLGLDGDPYSVQRVNNWKVRGIPPRVILDHLAVIQLLQRKSRRSK